MTTTIEFISHGVQAVLSEVVTLAAADTTWRATPNEAGCRCQPERPLYAGARQQSAEGHPLSSVTKNAEQTVRSWIESGELGPGARLPSERTLSTTLGIGRTTVRLVLMRLAAEGLIHAEHGRGYFVTEDDAET